MMRVLFSMLLLVGFAVSAAEPTQTFTDDLNRKVVVPVHPKRIVSLHDLDITIPLIELGVPPVASHGRTRPDGSHFLRSSGMLTGVDFDNSDIKFIGTADIDIEAIAAAKPDLIVTEPTRNTPVEQLAKIAPTVSIDHLDGGAPEIYRKLAQLTGTQARLKVLERRYQEQIKALKATIDTRKITVSVIQANQGKINAMHSYHSLGRVLRDAGFKFPPLIESIPEGGRIDVSAERLPELDADFAGALSAITLIAGSLWLLEHMGHHHGAPLLYAGVGLGIFISAEGIALGHALSLTSQQIWLLCALCAGLLLALAIRWLLTPPAALVRVSHVETSSPASGSDTRRAAWRLLMVYGLAGFGYIITATYLPLFLSGSLQSVDPVHLWALFGLAAAPSCLIWHKLVLKWGYRQALTRNLLVQALGVILPACSASLLFCVLSALLVGFTFMGTVTIALPKAKSLSHQVSFNMIAAMTALYGVGQIAGPLIAGALYQIAASFNPALYAAALALLIAAGLVFTERQA